MSKPHNFLSQLTGLLATPSAQNPSGVMVEAAYRHHGLDARYITCDVSAENLGDAVRGARAMGWLGFNCSKPHKVSVIAHLDAVAESAAVIGAVNCVVNRAGRLIGENTDGKGFIASLRTVADLAGKRMILLGAGGAARAIAVEAAMAGLLGVRLGGTNRYGDEVVKSAYLGGDFPPPGRRAARRAWKAVAMASILGFAGALLLTWRKRDV